MTEHDDEHLKSIASQKAMGDLLAKKGLAGGNDRWVTEASIEKANIDLEAAEAKRDEEEGVAHRIFAAGGKQGIMARLQERCFRIHTWQRVFRSSEAPEIASNHWDRTAPTYPADHRKVLNVDARDRLMGRGPACPPRPWVRGFHKVKVFCARSLGR